MFIGVILNPQARKNRLGSDELVGRLRRILGDRGEVHVTRTVEELGAVVEQLLPKVTHLVSAGGDGALNWLINEVRAQLGDERSEEWPTFVPTNGGTIDFVARHVGVRGHSEGITQELVDALNAERPPVEVTVDSLLIEGAHDDGAPFSRVSFALAAGGVGNRFFDKYYEDPNPTALTIVRVVMQAVKELGRTQLLGEEMGSTAQHMFRPTPARVSIDGKPLTVREHGCLQAGSFAINLGGIVRLFPGATDRGTLHLTAGAISPFMMVMNLPLLAAGKPLRAPELTDTSGHEMTVEAIDELLNPILDGERFEELRTLCVKSGPRVRIARVAVR